MRGSWAARLQAWYRQLCKRPCFHDDYLAAFNRPTTTLVDTNGRGIDAITEKGVVANGVEYEVDCIVLSTGFETSFTIPQVGDSLAYRTNRLTRRVRRSDSHPS